MKIEPKLEKALGVQVGRELFSANLYLTMSYWFDERALDGFKAWFKGHSDEERSHAEKIASFIVDRQGSLTLPAIEAIAGGWKTPTDVLQTAFLHEQQVTKWLQALCEAADEAGDEQTCRLMEDMLMEQVEEEKVFSDLLQQAQMLKDSPLGVFVLSTSLK